MVCRPRFEIAWGGNWSREHRRRCQESAEIVVGFAADFAERHNIEVRQNKRFTFCKRRPNTRFQGMCHGPTDIRVAVNRHLLGRGQLLGPSFTMVESGLHESIHAYRFERYTPDPNERDYPEHSLHEGLALASGLIAFKPPSSPSSLRGLAGMIERFDPRVASLKPGDYEKYVNQMIATGGDERARRHWLNSRPDHLNLCESVGLVGVTALLDEGVAFADILDTPASEVLKSGVELVEG